MGPMIISLACMHVCLTFDELFTLSLLDLGPSDASHILLLLLHALQD